MKSLKHCNLTIRVSDLDVSLSFYTGILGLQLTQRYGNHYAEIEGPGISIGLHPITAAPIGTKHNISIGFGVLKFDSEVGVLRDMGIAIEVTQDGPIRLAHFHDPDAHPLYLADIGSS